MENEWSFIAVEVDSLPAFPDSNAPFTRFALCSVRDLFSAFRAANIFTSSLFDRDSVHVGRNLLGR